MRQTSVSDSKAPNGMEKPNVQLIGKDGNAFMIMGLCANALKAAGFPQADVDKLTNECFSGDYAHLLMTATIWCDVT